MSLPLHSLHCEYAEFQPIYECGRRSSLVHGRRPAERSHGGGAGPQDCRLMHPSRTPVDAEGQKIRSVTQLAGCTPLLQRTASPPSIQYPQPQPVARHQSGAAPELPGEGGWRGKSRDPRCAASAAANGVSAALRTSQAAGSGRTGAATAAGQRSEPSAASAQEATGASNSPEVQHAVGEGGLCTVRPPQYEGQADSGIATGKSSGGTVKANRALPQSETLLNQPNQQKQQQQQQQAVAAADETTRAAFLAEASRQALGGSSEEGHWTAEQVQTRIALSVPQQLNLSPSAPCR